MFDHSSHTHIKKEEKVDVNPFVGWAIHYETAFGQALGCGNFSWGQDFKNLLEFAKGEGFIFRKDYEVKRTSFPGRIAILEKEMSFGKIVAIVSRDLPVKCNILLYRLPEGK